MWVVGVDCSSDALGADPAPIVSRNHPRLMSAIESQGLSWGGDSQGGVSVGVPSKVV